jgi:hypothetical protein
MVRRRVPLHSSPLCVGVALQKVALGGGSSGKRAAPSFNGRNPEGLPARPRLATPHSPWEGTRFQGYSILRCSPRTPARRVSRCSLSLCSGKSHSPDVTLVAPWDSLEKIRGSENNLFLTEEISRYLVCCEGLPHITVQELLACDFIATSPRAI